jgi:hypothetical protein
MYCSLAIDTVSKVRSGELPLLVEKDVTSMQSLLIVADMM